MFFTKGHLNHFLGNVLHLQKKNTDLFLVCFVSNTSCCPRVTQYNKVKLQQQHKNKLKNLKRAQAVDAGLNFEGNISFPKHNRRQGRNFFFFFFRFSHLPTGGEDMWQCIKNWPREVFAHLNQCAIHSNGWQPQVREPQAGISSDGS